MDGKWLVIGIGNILRGDDGVGWRAAELLTCEVPRIADVIACLQLTPELAEPLSQTDRVIFIDACTEGKPGLLDICNLQPRASDDYCLFHHLDPCVLLGLSQAWFKRCPDAVLVTVAGEQFDYQEVLSPPVQTALGRVVQTVHILVGMGFLPGKDPTRERM